MTLGVAIVDNIYSHYEIMVNRTFKSLKMTIMIERRTLSANLLAVVKRYTERLLLTIDF